MKRIIWDWNGTLLDDVDLSFACINRLLKENGLKPLQDLHAYRNVFDFPIQSYYRKVGFDFSIKSYDELAHRYMEDYQEKSYNCLLCKQVQSTLQKANELGYVQTILSASKKEYLDAQISNYHISDYIEDVLGIENIYAHSKTDLAKAYVDQCDPSDEVWFVGDSIHDYEVAQSVHAHCLLVTSGHQSRSRLQACGVPVFNNTKECLEYIHERNHNYEE